VSCPVCGSQRGLNIYCWNCGQYMGVISDEELIASVPLSPKLDVVSGFQVMLEQIDSRHRGGVK